MSDTRATKLSPVARLDLIEEVVDLSARAICLRHPDAASLARVTVGQLRDVADADLLAERDRLAAWIAERHEHPREADGR